MATLGLKQTSKGRLMYHNATDEQILNSVDKVTSPRISLISPQTISRNSDSSYESLRSDSSYGREYSSLSSGFNKNLKSNSIMDSKHGTVRCERGTTNKSPKKMEQFTKNESTRNGYRTDATNPCIRQSVPSKDDLKQSKVDLFSNDERIVRREAVVASNGGNYRVQNSDSEDIYNGNKENLSHKEHKNKFDKDYSKSNFNELGNLSHNCNLNVPELKLSESMKSRLGPSPNALSSINSGLDSAASKTGWRSKSRASINSSKDSDDSDFELRVRSGKIGKRRVRFSPYRDAVELDTPRALQSPRRRESSKDRRHRARRQRSHGSRSPVSSDEDPSATLANNMNLTIETFQRLLLDVQDLSKSAVDQVRLTKQNEFERQAKENDQEARRRWDEQKRKLEEREAAVVARGLSEEREGARVVEGCLDLVKDKHTQRAQAVSKQHRRANQEERERREQIARAVEEQQKFLDGATKLAQEQLDSLSNLITKCRSVDQLPAHISPSSSTAVIKQIYNKIESYRTAPTSPGVAPSPGPGAEMRRRVGELLEEGKKVLKLVETHVEKINGEIESKEKEEEEKRQKLEEQKKQEEKQAELSKQSAAASSTAATTAGTAKTAAAAAASGGSSTLEMEVASAYQKSQASLESLAESYKSLTSDSKNNRLRFELQKLVNIPINAIASTNGAHLRDKLTRLQTLLKDPVGSARGLAQGVDPALCSAFCKDLIGKRFICQAEEQVSRNNDDAFPFAAVALGLWADYDDLGRVILAHLYNKCPYAVPFYKPKRDDESKESYYKSLGYQVNKDGEIEEQDKFLGRMRGCMLLYAALTVSDLPPPTRTSLTNAWQGGANLFSSPSGPARPHPHGVQNLYSYLCRVLNQEPRQDITATCLLAALQMGSHKLFQTYDKQFVKMVRFIKDDYLARIVSITTGGVASGPVSRLVEFLTSLLKQISQSKRTTQPSGFLTSQFWSTS